MGIRQKEPESPWGELCSCLLVPKVGSDTGALCPCPPRAQRPAALQPIAARAQLLENAKGLGSVSTAAFEGDTDPRSRVCRRTK